MKYQETEATGLETKTTTINIYIHRYLIHLDVRNLYCVTREYVIMLLLFNDILTCAIKIIVLNLYLNTVHYFQNLRGTQLHLKYYSEL